MSTYRPLNAFAPHVANEASIDPLTYCVPDFLNSQFLHGTTGRTFGKYNKHCAEFMSQRCSGKWDNLCEVSSRDENVSFPDMTLNHTLESNQKRLTAGERLIRDSAYYRFKSSVYNCNLFCQPFDPTVANSPQICYEKGSACVTSDTSCTACSGDVEGGTCLSEYSINPAQIRGLDADIVMNKLIQFPWIAPMLLERIYLTMRRTGATRQLKGTRLGSFYEVNGMPL